MFNSSDSQSVINFDLGLHSFMIKDKTPMVSLAIKKIHACYKNNSLAF